MWFWPILISGLVSFCGVPEIPSKEELSGSPETVVYRLDIKGVITPSKMEILDNAIETATDAEAEALVVVLDTPGGLASSMDDMIRSILSSEVPVITFVWPPGTTSGSAGVYLMYASHLNAMAPGTNMGSATPVMIGGGGGGGEQGAPSGEDSIPEKAGTNDATNLKRKQINHAVAQIRSLAEYHDRNAEFGERTVTHADNVTSTRAVQIGAVDLLAESIEELLAKADGRTVRMMTERRTLSLQDVVVKTIKQDRRAEFLDIITNPNIAYILMMLGMLGIFAEIQYPGSIFPGVIGAICLILGMYAMQTLPINYAGLGLILLGLLLLIMEIKIFSYGLLSLAGLACMILGSVLLVRSENDLLMISIELIVGTSMIVGSCIAFLVYKAARVMRKVPVSPTEALFTDTGVVEREVTSEGGRVFVHSEVWSARCKGEAIPVGRNVRVVKQVGMVLFVEAADS